MNPSFFRRIEEKTGVPMEEVFALANAIQNANFQDERQVRKIVRKVAKLANKPVTKELEEQIVASILKNGKSLDLSKIQNMM
ncbi:sporulation protein [Rummeliibacillus sp. TYF005]|mgnify:FL=1|uniref:stage VI sporulation protein F n=1 Tax=unclassified Rummeliibacillus TaxID=2622809 RepID=UPI000E66B6A3|nr:MULTISPECIES: stage VI sporulation protein F [unclassified Rummeliibacillus]RIJ67678.1 sporulation protein [Rummeliibacillus sp. POC4]RPJ96242.1 sporulation protein [Rummeliibacillus sp. TYF005]